MRGVAIAAFAVTLTAAALPVQAAVIPPGFAPGITTRVSVNSDGAPVGGGNGYAAASERGVGHAERLAWRELERMGVRPEQVTRVYSELEPCAMPGGLCAAWIARTFANARVTWSFQYGATIASRSAGLSDLKDALLRLLK